MSDRPRRERGDESLDEVRDLITWGRWRAAGPLCQEEGFVNCTFGEEGECQNPRHKVRLGCV